MEIVTAQEMYEWDQTAIQTTGLSGTMLMENAGRSVSAEVEKKINRQQNVIVLIGGGNNGGDGYVIARTLLNHGYRVEAWQVVPDEKIHGDALTHKEIFLRSGYVVTHTKDVSVLGKDMQQADVIIDCMLGIGVKGKLRSPIREVVELVNEQNAYTISIDIPSGVPADEGFDEFDAVKADETVVIAAPKMSAFLESTSCYYGKWTVVEIGLPVKLLPNPRRQFWTKRDAFTTVPIRSKHSHKGSHGKGLVIGGSYHMPGSIAMTGRAALRSGIGLLSIATPTTAIPSVASFLREATFEPLPEEQGVMMDISGVDWSKYNGAAIGMGMGREVNASLIFQTLFQHAKGPILIDADALYHVKDKLMKYADRPDPVILTPHPGEFAHLIDRSIPEVMQSPFTLTRGFAEKYGVYVVLKGPATIITSPQGDQRVELSGNAGLAKGGSGDVLSGVLLALTLQSKSVFDALANGCMIHGLTAERLTENHHSTTGLLASDLIEGLSETFRTFSVST
nr:NAD(P)H-hydrate dehydratase [Halobacillus sp. A1]